MPTRVCSECGDSFESLGGRAPKLTCSPQCFSARNDRLRKVKRRLNIPTACSECGAALAQIGGRPFLTCGAECFDARNKRLKRQRAAEWRASRKFYCIDCSALMPDVDHARTARCEPCARKRRLELAAGRRARQQRTDTKPPPLASRRRLDNRLRSVYGITLDQYEAMAEAQGGRCGICGNPPQGRGKTDALVVDHCHSVGHVRMLLCGNCNIALGLLSDDPRYFDLAAAYLRRWAVAAS